MATPYDARPWLGFYAAAVPPDVDGFNVYPSEIEDVLATHPAVKESAAVGVPDRGHGEIVTAFVVLRPGHATDPRELIAFCAVRLAEYKVPTRIEIRAELPHNMLGKVLRRILREEQHLRRAG